MAVVQLPRAFTVFTGLLLVRRFLDLGQTLPRLRLTVAAAEVQKRVLKRHPFHPRHLFPTQARTQRRRRRMAYAAPG